jgi:hypothetical protein
MNSRRVGAASVPELRLHRRAVIWAACVIVAGAGAVWAGHRAWAALESSHSTPSCSWPVRIQGKPTPAQAGLIRCYLSALARRDTAALLAIAPTTPAVRITGADLAHSADARSGRATVTFLPALVDPMFVLVVITYADGTTDRLGVQNMIAMGGPYVWRMSIGTDVNPGTGGPPPAMLGVKVSGVFVIVGGPAPGVRLPLPGRVVATNTAGRRFTGTVGKSGRFTMWLPPGTYRLTGHSPRVHAGGRETRCAAAHPVRAQVGGSPTARVEVACSVRSGRT